MDPKTQQEQPQATQAPTEVPAAATSANNDAQNSKKKTILIVAIVAVFCCIVTTVGLIMGMKDGGPLSDYGGSLFASPGEKLADELDVLVDTAVLNVLQESETLTEITTDIDQSKLEANEAYGDIESMEFSGEFKIDYSLSEALFSDDPTISQELGNELAAIAQAKSGTFTTTMSGLNNAKDFNNIQQRLDLGMSFSIPGTTVEADIDIVGMGDDAYITINSLPLLPIPEIQEYIGSTIHYSAADFGLDQQAIADQEEAIKMMYAEIIRESGITEIKEEDIEKIKEVFRLPAVIDYVTRLDNETIGDVKTECYALEITKESAPDLIVGIGEIFVPEENPAEDRAEIATDINNSGFESITLNSCFGKKDDLIHKLGFDLDMSVEGNTFDISGHIQMWNFNEDLTVEAPAGPYKELIDLLPPGTVDELGSLGAQTLFGIPSSPSPYADPYETPGFGIPESGFDIPTPTVNSNYATCVNAPNSIGCSACNFPDVYAGGVDYCGDCEAAYQASLGGIDPETINPDFDIYCTDF